MSGLKLRDYQLEAVDYGLKHPYCILALCPGLGKTAVSITVREKTKGNCLIVCPAYLISNWQNELRLWADPKSVVTCFRKSSEIYEVFDADYVLISYDLAQKAEWLFKWAEVLILDECFDENTEIETSEGTKKIKDVGQGDYVKNCLGFSRVKAVLKREVFGSVRLTYQGKTITCSLNHPFLTSRGWVKAKDLKQGEDLVTTDFAMRILQSEDKAEDPCFKILRQVLLSEMENAPAGDSGKGTSCGGVGKISKEEAGEERSRSQCEDEGKQSYEKSVFSQEDDQNSSKDEAQAFHKRWKWPSPDQAREFAYGKISRASMEFCSLFGASKSWVSNLLQAGPSFLKIKIGDRGGRHESPASIEEAPGPKKRRNVNFIRLENIEIQERGNSGKPCSSFFYDLEVEGHPSFTVNGALVHNSHLLKSQSTKRTQFFHRVIYENSLKRVIQLTGTPIKNRTEEFYSLLAICNYDPSLKKSEFLDRFPDSITFADYFSHRREYTIQVGHRFVRIVKWEGIKRTDELKKWLTGHYLRIKSEDVLELPPISYKEVLMSETPDAELLNAFNSFVEESGDSVDPTAKAQAALKKAPITVQYVKNLLEEVDCVVVYSDHVEASEFIAKAFNTVALNGSVSSQRRMDIAMKFQAGEGKVLVATIKAMSVGINLTRASHMVLNDFCWTPGDLKQTVYRIQRLGQQKPCVVHEIVGSPQDKYIKDVIKSKMGVIERAT